MWYHGHSFLSIFLIAATIQAMQELPKDAQRRRDISFKAVALYRVGINNPCIGLSWLKRHPLLEDVDAEYKPYTDGNGGLLNPILKKFNTSINSVKNENSLSTTFCLEGEIAADGIAPYRFEETHFGDHKGGDMIVKDGNIIAFRAEYKMSLLEEVILGMLKERSIDRQLSDINDTGFEDHAKKPYSDRFKACIIREWTGKQNDADSGMRSSEDNELIKRHLPRSAFWHSRYNTPSEVQDDNLFIRTGEHIRLQWLNGKRDPLASVELKEFEFSVKIPEKQ